MKKIVSILLMNLFISAFYNVQAQIKVSSTNNIGIGTENPISKLSVGADGNSYAKAYIYNSNTLNNSRGLQIVQESTAAGSWGYGLVSSSTVGNVSSYNVGISASAYSTTAYSFPKTYGLYAIAGNGQPGYNYGLFARLYGSNNGAAVFAAVGSRLETSVPRQYAGYFRGEVYIEDSLRVSSRITCSKVYEVSDENMKTNVNLLGTGNLNKINQLNAVKYQLIPENSYLRNQNLIKSDSATVEKLSLEPEKQVYIGLLAQELQKLYPELVKKDENGVLSVNYTGLVPVLIEGMKEQQAEIEALKVEIEALKSKQ